MRLSLFVFSALFAAMATGCSGSDKPVTVTPEMEAEQKQAEKAVYDEERINQKNQKLTGKPAAEDEERARSQGR